MGKVCSSRCGRVAVFRVLGWLQATGSTAPAVAAPTAPTKNVLVSSLALLLVNWRLSSLVVGCFESDY